MGKKRILKLFTILLLLLFLSVSNIFAKDISNLYCKSAIIMDNDSGKLLFGINENKKVYPASTTKVLTAILALENLDINSSTVVSKDAIKIPYDSSNAALKYGEVMTIKDLLYALMLKSGNDCANVLGESVSGSIDKFIILMNEKAKEIGCTNTHFTNAHGYHDDNHYTTPSDMMKILSYAIKNEDFVKIFSTKSYTIEPTNKTKSKRIYQNTNRLILTKDESYLSRYYEYCIGGKTGYTDEAGRTLVAYGKKDNKNLIIGIFNATASGSEDVRYTDAISLFEHGFNNFEKTKVLDKNNYKFSYENHDTDLIYNYSISDDVYALSNSAEQNEFVIVDYEISLNYEEINKYDINSTDYKNQDIGTIKITFRQNSSEYNKEFCLKLDNITKIDFFNRKSTQKLSSNIVFALVIIILIIIILTIIKIVFNNKKKNKTSNSSHQKRNIKYKSRRIRKIQ